MKFLYVFCVVLNLKYGDCLERAFGNNPSILNSDPKNIQLYGNNKKIENPWLLHDYSENEANPNDKTHGVGAQSISTKVYSEPYNRGNFRIKEKFIHSNSNNDKQEKQGFLNQNLPREISQTQPIKQNINLNKNSFSHEFLPRKSIEKNYNQNPEQETRLELQGISPEYINSLINQNLHEPSSSIPQYNAVNTPQRISPQNYAAVNTASYLNPSAEVLYNINQALPYRINSNSFSNHQHQVNNNLQNILKKIGPLQNIASHLSKPERRYTVIYPNGRIEYTNEIESIIAQHPDYTLVTSNDIIKHIKNDNTPKIPLLESNLKKKIAIKNIQSNVDSGDRNDTNLSLPITDFPRLPKENTGTLPNSTIISANTLPTNVNITIETKSNGDNHTNKSMGEVIAISSDVQMLNVSEVLVKGSNNTNTDNLVQKIGKISQHNALSNIDTNVTVQKKESLDNNTVLTAPTNDYSIVQNLNNLTNFNETTIDTQIFVSDSLHDATSLLPIGVINSNKTISEENNAETNSSLNNIETNNTNNKEISLNNNTVLTVPTNKDTIVQNLNNLTNRNETQTIDTQIFLSDSLHNATSLLPIGVINSNRTISEENNDETNAETNSSNSNLSPPSNHGDISKNSAFMFEPDNTFWDKVTSNKDNVFYFLFVPPKSKTRNTKTTIYPNGTSVTEVVETVDDDDSVSTSQSVTITHVNGTVI